MEETRESLEKVEAASKIATDVGKTIGKILIRELSQRIIILQSELEVNAQTRRMQLLEEELARVRDRLNETISKLEFAEKAAEESERGRKLIESR